MARAVISATPGSRREAASRLRHDLGKAVRLSAPSGALPAESVEALRSRLAADLLGTRSAPGETLDAVAVFDRWWNREAAILTSHREAAACLERIRAAIEVMRPLLPVLHSLPLESLRRLDAASQVLDVETRALRDALTRDESETRP